MAFITSIVDNGSAPPLFGPKKLSESSLKVSYFRAMTQICSHSC